MKGKISEYNLDSFLAWVDVSTNRTENGSESEPCAEYENDDGENDDDTDDNENDGSNGGSGSIDESGNDNNESDHSSGEEHDSFGAGGEFENTDEDTDENEGCNILVWSNGETGDVTGISWSCSDGSHGYGGTDRIFDDEDCPGDGDVAVNANWPYTNCARFEYANVGNIKGAQTTGVKSMFTATRVTSPSSTEFIAISILYPTLFFTMSSGWTNGLAANMTAQAMDASIDQTQRWFIENPDASQDLLQLTWFNFMKLELAKFGGTVQKVPLFPVRSPAPYTTSWLPSNCL